MKAWEKLEEKLNKLLLKLGSIFLVLFKRNTPEKIEKKYSDTKETLAQKKLKLKKLANAKKIKIIEKSKILKEKSNILKQKALKKSTILAKDIKEFDPKKVNVKKKLLIFAAIITPILQKSKVWLITLKPATLIGTISVTTVVGLTTISFYSQVDKISDKMEEGRDPATLGKNKVSKVRATYHKQTEKELKVQGLNMPVYVGESKKLKSVVIDFTMIASNRYIPNFFANRPHYLVDKMNSTLHPFIPEASLEDEGKIILKDKIRIELNLLLEKLHIKGEIKEIHIHSLLAG